MTPVSTVPSVQARPSIWPVLPMGFPWTSSDVQVRFMFARLSSLSSHRKKRRSVRRWVIAGIGSIVITAAVGSVIAFANSDSEGGVTGRQADRAIHAALETTGGGTANAVESDSENGASWEVEVRTPDGRVGTFA